MMRERLDELGVEHWGTPEEVRDGLVADYAWIIDKDHLHEPGKSVHSSDEGRMGPLNASGRLVSRLQAMPAGKSTSNIFTFKMYDDDNILYYSGRIIVDATTPPAIISLMGLRCPAPLDDFGTPKSGAVAIRYPGNSRWDVA